MLAQRKVSLGELEKRVAIRSVNLSLLKNGSAKAMRFSSSEAIWRELDCPPGDIMEYRPKPSAEKE